MGAADVIETLREHGGIVTAGVLRPRHPRADIAAALAGGDVVRAGQGRYALRSAVPDARHAVRLNGVVAGLSAAHWWGWSLAQDPELPVVAVPRKRHIEPERRSDVRVIHVDLSTDRIVQGEAARATPWGPRLPDLARVTDKLTTAAYIARTEPLTTSLAVLDSARRDGITPDQLHAALAREPNQWRARAHRRRPAGTHPTCPCALRPEKVCPVTERKYPDLWVDPENDPRAPDAEAKGEKAVLGQYLDHYRMTLEMKCDGLDAEQLARRSVPPSTLSLLGLVRHMAKVEHSWFRRKIEQQDLPRLYWSEEDRDLDFNGAVADDDVVEDAWEAWWREITHARKVYEGLDLDAVVDVDGEPTEAREIIVHMVEEYARHAGHADLLRECIDGRTGQ